MRKLTGETMQDIIIDDIVMTLASEPLQINIFPG